MDYQLRRFSRMRAFFWIFLAYFAGLAAFFFTVDWLFAKGYHPFLAIGMADLAGTVVVFIFSYLFKNTSFYDPYWSVLPIFIAFLLAIRGLTEGLYDINRTMVVLFLVSFWALRLTWNWARGWKGLRHIDWRYVDLEKKTGKWFWLLSFSGLHLFPTVLVFMGCLPLFAALADTQISWHWLDFLATAWTLGAILTELVADNQLRKYKRNSLAKGETLISGIWKYSRHPNYFGETAFWWGIFLFGLAANPAYWWTIIGPICMSMLFHFISIPMIEKRHFEVRKDYVEVMKKVPRWIPWFPKK